jgi:hypothetical protein
MRNILDKIALYLHHMQRDEAASHANADAAASRKAAQLYRAARAIQDAWRGRANRRIFRYYQQLLAFR